MKKIILIFYLLFFCKIYLLAQIPDIYYTNATAAANLLVGNNVTVSNATFSGNSKQLARFTDGLSKVGFPSGVLLTTGDADFAGEFGCVGCGTENQVTNNNTDTDLDLLNGPGTVKTPAILEFDFVTTGSTLNFEFIFASKEYPEYVGSQFNDAFGFFLSGPGISGPYSNSAENIARLPNNSIVSINTVNQNTNSNFYIDNPWFNQGPLNENNALFRYDGKTTVITVDKQIQCNTTYHLKIAICNTKDQLFDSGVFLKQGSLRSDFQLSNIVADVQPICEGQNLNLSITGDNNWTYTWTQGQNNIAAGVGLKNITVVADPNNTVYTVTATNQDGCMLSKTITVNVHPNNNIAPTTNGVNNTGDFTYYMQAYGGTQSFNIPSFDNPNERVEFITSITNPTLPNGSNFNDDNTFQETATFTWSPTLADVGVHQFTVRVQDRNVCGELFTDYTYTVNVVCDYCPLDVYYQDRRPNFRPLPAYTVAGRKIVAGYNVISNQPFGNVGTGTANVTFEAAQVIEMNPGFTGGANYTAIINPNACTANCQNCCDNNNGFTLDQPIGNFFTPDGDGIQDIWQVTDVDHPYCAYNAKEFNLQIFNRWGNRVHHKTISSVNCCPFRSVSANTPSVVSSINWDGRVNFGPWASAGTYFYVLVLNGCNNSNFYIGEIHLFNSQARMAYEDSLTTQQMLTEAQLDSVINWVKEENGIALDVEPIDLNPINELVIYPNPTVEYINVSLTGANYMGNSLIEIYDMQGQLIWNKRIFGNSLTINATSFAKGTYLVRMLNNKTTYTKTFIKQ